MFDESARFARLGPSCSLCRKRGDSSAELIAGISDQSKLLVVTKSRLNLARGRHRSVSSLCCFMRSAQLAEQQGSSTMLAIALNWKERLLRSLVEDT